MRDNEKHLRPLQGSKRRLVTEVKGMMLEDREAAKSPKG